VPFVSPVSVAVVAPVVEICSPPDEVTVYLVIVEPPLSVGAVHDTTAWRSPAVALTAVGAPGTVIGVTGSEAVEVTESPAALVAVTVKVYAVPFVRPVTVTEVSPVVVADAPAGDDVTV